MSRLAPVQLRAAHPEPPLAVWQRRDTRLGAWLPLALLTLAGLALRLAVWRWHAAYPLGGDEREYFDQALTFLQGKGYRELPLMRPPLYTAFLAVVFRLFDSQVQRVRLVQELIGAGTIPLMWLWARVLLGPAARRGAIVTAGLAALCYTFAANASELLTETTFLAGLTLLLWLLVAAARAQTAARARYAMLAAAGLTLGALCLLRSVALPLLPLGAVWLLRANKEHRTKNIMRMTRTSILCSMLYVLCSLLVILPWTARNYSAYGTPILIDTTGAENLWLDNDPRGREAVKRELYALGDDRGARQQLAMQRGIAVIAADPGRFAAKAWAEAQKFMALEYFDDLRARPAIWVPPLEVWLRLVLGDGVWLVVLGGGIAGLWLGPNGRARWLLVPWVLYVFLTGLVFHVELRYRLPIYPALLPYAGWALTRLGALPRLRRRAGAALGAAATMCGVLGLLGLHRAYLPEAAMLARKHYYLALAHAASAPPPPDAPGGRAHALAALALDPESALARVELGRFEPAAAERWWREAIAALPAHPYAHLLLGNQLRHAGQPDAARSELAFETSSLEDLQRWAVDRFDQVATSRVDVGDGLDLGAIQGFYPAAEGARWTKPSAAVYVAGGPAVSLRLRSPRPGGAPAALVRVIAGDTTLDPLAVGAEWQTFTLPLPEALRDPETVVTLRLQTSPFRPRAYDRADGDNRLLGVEVDWVASGQALTNP